MEINLLKMAFERMHMELETIKLQNAEFRQELEMFKANLSLQKIEVNKKPEQDMLIDTREVLYILGICYNSLQKIIQNGGIKPIRINQRRIRYSKNEILDYIKSIRAVDFLN